MNNQASKDGFPETSELKTAHLASAIFFDFFIDYLTGQAIDCELMLLTFRQ